MVRWRTGVLGWLAATAVASAASDPSPPATTAPANTPPELVWAYPVAPPGTPPLKPPPGTYPTPDGRRTLTATEVEALTPAQQDWFPDQHPRPPAVVLRAREGVAPCAECHLPNGQGEVGVPDLAGLRADYLVEQLRAFRAGTRRSSHPGLFLTGAMIGVAKALNEREIRAAAAYFASLPRHTVIQVVVSDDAPAMQIERFGWTFADPAGGRRPLDGGVAEAPESMARVFLADPTNRQFVYASASTIAAGEALVRSGGGGGTSCRACHGDDLRGTATAPPLAGRSPSYLARQIWDIRGGTRGGPGVAAMQGSAHGLSPSDITAIAAYLASLPAS